MRCHTDTNVLARTIIRTDQQYRLCRSAVLRLRRSGNTLCVSSQNQIELWNALTRPVLRNGFGLSPAAALRQIERVERTYEMLDDSPAVYQKWKELAAKYGVSGAKVHDTRLVAVMLVHGVTHILTFNTADFARFAPEGIVAVDPATA